MAGPTTAPKPMPGKKVVFLSGDEQNDISQLYGVYIKEAGEKLGWKVTIIDGKGSPTSWLAGLTRRSRSSPTASPCSPTRASLQDPIKAGVAQGIKFVGLHAAGLPGPQPDLNLFVNIQEDPREIGKAEADWVIADSDGKARVVILSHNEYADRRDQIERDQGPRSRNARAARCWNTSTRRPPRRRSAMPQLTTSWVQRFGTPLYVDLGRRQRLATSRCRCCARAASIRPRSS